MRFLEQERNALEGFLPSLDGALSAGELLAHERPGSGAIEFFREAGGPGLLIPREHSGLGATALEAIRVQRAIASRAPSLAIATTMHHFSIATLVALSRDGSGFEWMLLEGIASASRLVASGFAEGRSNSSVLKPVLRAERRADGWVLSGSKKPCSLSASMDLLTASVSVPSDNGGDDNLGVALIAADAEGLVRRPFWGSSVLAGAESDELELSEVEVSDNLLIRLDAADGGVGDVEAEGFLWFELLITASYLGIASALAERVFDSCKGADVERAYIGIELQGAMTALEGIARTMDSDGAVAETLERALMTRYLIQDAIIRASHRSIDLLGGMAFIRSSEVAYLGSACHALSFHPPSRSQTLPALAAVLVGEPLEVG